MNHRRHLTLGLGSAALALGAAPWTALAQPADAARAWAAVQAEALKEKKVVVYHNISPTGTETVAKEFRRDFPGVQVDLVRMSSAALLQRFTTEFAANRNIADVVITTADQGLYDGVASGWAVAWVPPELKAFPPAVNHKGRNMLFNIQSTRDALVWNKQKVRPADVPKDWADLFDPKWKGRIGMNPPWRSVTQQAIIAYWDKLGLGDTAAKMKANEVRFFEGSGGVLQALIRGDIHVAQMLDLPLESALADGAPIGVLFPKSGTTLSQVFAFVSAKGQNRNAAKVFTNWLMSGRGQVILQVHGGLPATRPGTPPMRHLPPTAELSNVRDALELIPPEKQAEIVAHWRKTFGIQ